MAQALYKVGDNVIMRDKKDGDTWSEGVVTNLSPLTVQFRDNDAGGGYIWDEVRPATAATTTAKMGEGKDGAQNAEADEEKEPPIDLTFDRMRELYPMLCHCAPDGDVKPCRFTPKGHKGSVPMRRKLLWTLPFMVWFGLKYHKISHMKKFYIDDYPVASLNLVGLFSVLSVIIDAFTDPKMASWTDNFRSKHGRRRPFFFFSAFFVPVVFVLGWVPPMGLSPLGASIWFGAFHIMFKLADTVSLIPLEAYGAQLTPSYAEQSKIWSLRELFANLGVLVGATMLPLLFVDERCSSTPGSPCEQHPLISGFLGVFWMISCLAISKYAKEPSSHMTGDSVLTVLKNSCTSCLKTKPFTEEDIIPTLISSFLNRPFRSVLLSSIARSCGWQIPFAVLPFMTEWVVGERCMPAGILFAALSGPFLLTTMCSLCFWVYLSRRVGKYWALVVHCVLLVVSFMLFVLLQHDTGDCSASILASVLATFWGFAYGGTYLIKDLLTSVIDYDEFLTGGRRREGVYMMAVEFVPKFMEVPGECVPFILMAALKYHRPPLQQPPCTLVNNTLSSQDAICNHYYSSETIGETRCSATKRCADLLADGVEFICLDAREEGGACGIKQNGDVRTLLVLCFSVVPAFFTVIGIIALYFYPKEARSETGYANLNAALSKLRRGETVEDPWRPGAQVRPTTQENIPGALAYFWTNELRAAVPATGVDYNKLMAKAFGYSIFFALLIVPGILLVILGLEDLGDEDGASITPVGFVILGIGVVGLWFNSVRVWAGLAAKRTGATREQIVAYYNFLCQFTGETHIS